MKIVNKMDGNIYIIHSHTFSCVSMVHKFEVFCLFPDGTNNNINVLKDEGEDWTNYIKYLKGEY